MEEEFHAIIKLVSGEEIFSLVMVENPDDEDPLLVLQNPLIMYMHTVSYTHLTLPTMFEV